MRRVGEVVA